METKQSDSQSGFRDPIDVFKEAVVKLETFTQEGTALDLTQEGRLVATESPPLKRVIALAKCYIGPLLSDQIRQKMENKLSKIKQEVLQARDILNSHSSLIPKWEEGDTHQKTLAQSARCLIERYNAIVTAGLTGDQDYNFEKKRLLMDEAIKGQPIQLPRTVCITSDCSLPIETTQKTFKEIGAAFEKEPLPKKSSFQTTHKKNEQILRDSFYVKATRLAKNLPAQYSLIEIPSLIKQGPIVDMEEKETIIMQQQLEIAPGSSITILGSFKQHFADLKFMSMPIVNDFRILSKSIHSGFPYPSQEAGWSLCDTLVDAQPLRTEQVPIFHQTDRKKKELSQLLLFDPKKMSLTREDFLKQKNLFDTNRKVFIGKHRKVQELLLNPFENNPASLLDPFYSQVYNSSSSFDFLSALQHKWMDGVIIQPAKKLEAEWLENIQSPLRTGKPAERQQRALQIFEEGKGAFLHNLSANDPCFPFLNAMAETIGPACHRIALQYISEKVGFAPPMLNDFERKIQMCAFEQLLRFLSQNPLDLEGMSQKYERDIEILDCETIDDFDTQAALIANELEIYFISRSKYVL